MKYAYYLHRNGDLVRTFQHSFPDGVKSGSNITKHYKMNYAIYRKLAGAVCEMFETKKNEIIFITYTTKNIIEHEKINKLFSLHLRNLKKNYDLGSYIWVAEYQKRGAIHYHALFDIPYIPVLNISRSWSNTIRKFSPASKNSVQLSKKWGGVVKNKERALKYVCKYFSKDILRGSNQFKARIYAITNNLVKKPVKLDENDALAIMSMQQGFSKTYDWATVFFLSKGHNLYNYFDETTIIEHKSI